MTKIKKVAAGILAAVSMATCVAGMSASAATATRTFYAGTKAVTASVSLGYASYYGASTSCNNSSVTDRYVSLEGYVSGGGTVSDYGYSKNGTASASVTTGSTFGSGYSSHSADYGTSGGHTTMNF